MGATVPNAEQAAQWAGREAEHWVEFQEQWDRLLAPVSDALLDAAAVAPGERVLDVGCGCGASTLALARAAAPGAVLGVDLSGPMLARARERAAAETLANATFEQGDAQVHPFAPGSFDVVVSRFGVMYFDDPEAAFANLASALRPGGRLAFCCFQAAIRNTWVTVPAVAMVPHVGRPRAEAPAKGPFSLHDPDAVRTILDRAGLVDVAVAPLVRDVTVGADLDDACRFVAENSAHRPFLEGKDEATTARALGAVRAALARHDTGRGVVLGVAAWLVTAARPAAGGV